jgi:hypothetical protein
MKGARSNTAIFRWPLLIAVLTAIGLLSALVGDDGWDALSWALLAVPVGLGGYFSLARR